jgi:murein hydrolase activator
MPNLRFIAIAALAAAVMLHAIPAHAEQDPSKAQKELERIERELKSVKKKTSETERKERSVLDELDRMDRTLAEKRRDLKRAQTALDKVSAAMAETEDDITKTTKLLMSKHSDLSERLRAMYITQKAGGNWAVLLSGGSGSLLKRYKYLSVMSERDKRLMDGYSGSLSELISKKQRLEDQKARYAKLKTARDEESRRVQSDELGKKQMLASIRSRKNSYISMQQELEQSGARMKELIRRLEESARAKPVPDNIPGLTGGLDWPVKGKVISRFGKQKHPEYDTYIFKKGIEVQAALGSDVHAVAAAEVVFADWFKGLGLVAILKHGGDYYSVYAHLADIRVKLGDKVARGQVIATLGDSGTSTGPSLYFEIRKGSEAIDPLKLLK